VVRKADLVSETIRLDIYVEHHCLMCRRSVILAEQIQRQFPEVTVRVIDTARDQGEHSDLVVATPTFILNGRTFSLGNPSKTEIDAAILALLRGTEA